MKINEQNIYRDSLVSILRGKEKSNVLLEVYRKLENEKLAFDVQRNRVPIQSVTASYMLDNELGYIKIEQFTENTDQELRDRKSTRLNSSHVAISYAAFS